MSTALLSSKDSLKKSSNLSHGECLKNYNVVGYHTTIEICAENIKEQGFRIGAFGGFGCLWGTGVYLALDELTSNFYEHNWMEGTETLIAEALLFKVLVVDFRTDRDYHLQVKDALVEATYSAKFDNNWELAYASFQKDFNLFKEEYGYFHNRRPMETLTHFMTTIGYEGMIIQDNTGNDYNESGGNQVVIFNPKLVQVI